jgi:DNA-binding NarL/FixJ family response regulator
VTVNSAADPAAAPRWPLIGRDGELARVVASIEKPRRGVLLAGAPGVGKTRLAHEALARAAQSGWEVATIAATGATTGIPFGAVAHLLPRGAPPASDLSSLLGQLVETLMERSRNRRVVVSIDDAQFLDELSAALVHHITVSGVAPVVVTTRTGEPAPDAVTSLYKDGWIERLELEQLSREEVSDLLGRVLGGYVAEQTLARLWRASNGNVLYLRELILDALDAGTLTVRDGVWRWSGGIGPAARLSELIGARLGGLAQADGELVEVLAVSEPLEVALVERMFPAADLVTLERRGVVECKVSDRRTEVRLGHPLYGEVITARIGAYQRRRICRLLADQLEATGLHRRGDLLRVALWRVQSGTAGDARQLTAAAEHANRIHDPATAELLARASLDLEQSFAASLQLGAALLDQGRLEDAEGVLAALSPYDADDAGRKGLAVNRMRTLFYGLGRAEAAESAVASIEAAMEDESQRLVLRGWRCMMLSHAGRFREAADLAGELAASPNEQTRIVGLPTVATARILAGRIEDAIAMTEECVRIAGARAPLSAPLAALRILALAADGQLEEAEGVASQLFPPMASSLQRTGEVVLIDTLRADVLLMRGRPRSALRLLRDVAGVMRQHTTGGFLGWCLSQQVEAAALLGDHRAARVALEEALRQKEGAVHLFDGAASRSRAWCHAAEGAWSRAAAELMEVAERLTGDGELSEAVHSLHDALRLGAGTAALQKLNGLLPEVDGRLAGATRLHVGALLHQDPAQMESAALAFESLGALLEAAELMVEASDFAAGRGLKRRAAAARKRATDLLAQCEGAMTPLAARIGRSDRLSKRESEVAHLALAGLTNRQIADKLYLSVRTIESQLQQAYTKLGINGRAALPDALAGGPGVDSEDG